jgi:hypothetical protein
MIFFKIVYRFYFFVFCFLVFFFPQFVFHSFLVFFAQNCLCRLYFFNIELVNFNIELVENLAL